MMYAMNYCTCTETYEPEHTYTFTGPCMKTGKPYSVTVPAEGLYRANQGESVQKAFPHLSSDDREFLISGYSPEGWKLLFPPEEEEIFHNGPWEDEDEDLL
jgi:hypothetical protein